MDQYSPIRLALGIVVAVVGLVGAAHLQSWHLRQAFTFLAAIGTVISVALLANWFIPARGTSSDARAGSEAVRFRTRPLFLLTLAAAALSVVLTATIPRAQEAREDARQSLHEFVSAIPPDFDGEVYVEHSVSTETYIELPLLGVSIVLLLTTVHRRSAVPTTFLLIGFILLAIPVVVGVAAVPGELETDLLYYLRPCLRILGWIAIAWYCFCLARSRQANIDQPRSRPSADQPDG